MKRKSVDIIRFFVNLFGLALVVILTELPYSLATSYPSCDEIMMVIIKQGATISVIHILYCMAIFKVNLFFDKKSQKQRERFSYVKFPALQLLLLVFITVSESFFLYHSACCHSCVGGNP